MKDFFIELWQPVDKRWSFTRFSVTNSVQINMTFSEKPSKLLTQI